MTEYETKIINARYQPTTVGNMVLDKNGSYCSVEAIELLQNQKQQLIQVLANVLPWVVTQAIACNGLKCREAVCLSCTDEETVDENVDKSCEAEYAARQLLTLLKEDTK